MKKKNAGRRFKRNGREDAPTNTEDGDSSLFRRAVAGARPLTGEFVEPVRKRIPAKARFARQDERAALDESLNAPIEAIENGSGDSLAFRRDSVGRRTFRQLSRGRFSIQAEVDLHGMTVAEAREALEAFIDSSLSRGLSCVRVIHGKGRGSGQAGPVLKPRVDGWLRRWDHVLAFVSAKPVDGGTGALYVLLKP